MGEVNYKLLKIIVYVFNLVLLLVGLALIIIGSLFLTMFRHEYHFARFSVQAASIAFVTIGSVMLVFALLGILVLRIEGKPLVLVHIAGLVIAFIALATLAIWGLIITLNGSLEAQTRKELWDTLNNYNETSKSSVDTMEFNWLQQKFHCCGVDSYGDWLNNTSVWYRYRGPIEKFFPVPDSKLEQYKTENRSLVEVPDTCCNYATNTDANKNTNGCGKEFQELIRLYTTGCFQPFYEYLSNDMKIICGIAAALAILSLIAIALLVFVCLSLKADYSPLSTN